MHLPPTYPYSLSLHDALPIFPPVDRDRCDVRRRVSRDEERLVRRRATSRTVIVESFSRLHPDVTASHHLREKPCRSEERRVGKECRTRGARYRSQDKTRELDD